MKTLSVVGTAAMFLVGGSILIHGVPGSHRVVDAATHAAAALPAIGGMLSAHAAAHGCADGDRRRRAGAGGRMLGKRLFETQPRQLAVMQTQQ